MTRKRTLRGAKLTVLALAALLSACGGGATDEAPPVPTGLPGTLDATFGNGGIVLTTPNAPAAANAMVLQPDGMIVVAGSIGEGAAKSFYLLRYKSDGTVDAGFGNGGTVTTVFDLVAGSVARALVLQPDGKIVVVGGSDAVCALARYNVDGTLDASFGIGGLVQRPSTIAGGQCTSVALQSDGKILATLGIGLIAFGGYKAAVMRFNLDGGRDSSFGVDGEAGVGCSYQSCAATGLTILRGGKIVVTGQLWYAGPFGGGYQLFLSRLASDGQLDPEFGFRPLSLYSLCEPTGIVSQPDERILLVACLDVARILTDGSIDLAFGAGGRASLPVIPEVFLAAALSLQSNGKLVVAGGTYLNTPDGGDYTVALVRYDAVGALDTVFGAAGVVRAPIVGSAAANTIGILPDGRIVVAGNVTSASGKQGIFLARYFGDATGTGAH